MKIGYARVSTRDQNLDAQIDALTKAGCDRIFEEVASGARCHRPILAEALKYARPGDAMVFTKLDRVARSLPHLIQITTDLKDRGIEFVSLTESLDTASPGGQLVFNIFGAIAQFERDLIRERTRAGLEAAKRRGRKGGRPRSMTEQKRKAAEKLLAAGTPAKDVAETIGVSVPTLYRHCPAGVTVQL